MRRQICKLLAILLAITMVAAMVPGMAFAAEIIATPGGGEASGEMSGDTFLKTAKNGKITLTGDVTLTDSAQMTKNQELTIDLNGHVLTSQFKNSWGANNSVIYINRYPSLVNAENVKLTITDSAEKKGMLKGPDRLDSVIGDGYSSSSYATIFVDSNAKNVTITIDGAVVQGGDAYSTKNAQPAISIQRAKGDCKIILQNNALVCGGNGYSESGNLNPTYTSGMELGRAIDIGWMGGNYGTLNIEINNSTVIGGESKTSKQAQAGHAIYAYQASGVTITATHATITGGSSSKGIAGSAIEFSYSANGSVTIKDGSILTGGNSGTTWSGRGICANSSSSPVTIEVEDSTIIGGKTPYQYGEAIRVQKSSDSITLKNVKLLATDKAYGLVICSNTPSEENAVSVSLSGRNEILTEREGDESSVALPLVYANITIVPIEGKSFVLSGPIGEGVNIVSGEDTTPIPSGTTLYAELVEADSVEDDGVTYTGDGTLVKDSEGALTVTGSIEAAFDAVGESLIFAGTDGNVTYTAKEENVSVVLTEEGVTAGEGCRLIPNDDGGYDVVIGRYSVTVEQTAGGAVTVNPAEPSLENTPMTLTVKPDEGYDIVAVTSTVRALLTEPDTAEDGTQTFTFDMPAEDVIVYVTFALKQEDDEAPPTIVDKPTVETEIPDDVSEQLPEDFDPSEGLDVDPGEAVQEMESAGIEAAEAVTQDELDKALEELAPGDKQVYIHILTTIDTKVTDYEEDGDNKTLTLDITPHYHVIATTARNMKDIHLQGDEKNAVQLTEEEITVTKPVNITVPVPAAFAGEGAKVYIKHTKEDGKVHWYTGEVKDGVVSFENPDGFSTFEIRTSTDAQAKIGERYYDTLQEAVDTVKEGETITVLTGDPLTATAPAKNITFTVENGDNVTIQDNGNYHVSKSTDGKYTVTYVAPPVPTTPTPSNPDEPDTDPVDAFVDVPAGAWYRDALNYVLENTTGVINGTDATHFSPNEKLTRAAFAKILWAIEGSKPTTAENPFTDVKSGDWFYDAVIWANAQGIMLGKGENLCAPNDNITREEMALMIQRWKAGKAAGEVTFPDAKDVHDWAADAVAWAAEQSYIKGKDDGRFAPLDSLTRAEMITVVARTLGFEG